MLVGYTGFVGSNINKSQTFDFLVNSKNIESAYKLNPELLIYSGVPAEMFLANKYPENDKKIIENAKENIRKINAKTTVLISTVAVYEKTKFVDEDYTIDDSKLTPYGKNRLDLERWVENNCKKHLIVRLPAIFGDNLKKNFLYDYINFIPAMLKENKYKELSLLDEVIKFGYKNMENGFYKCIVTDLDKRKKLRQSFERVGFSALNFTDSRSVYQFFDLSLLYEYIIKCIENNIRKINIVTPPLSVSEVYKYLSNKEFKNFLPKEPFYYDIRTKYTANGYIMSKKEELEYISNFVDHMLSK